MAGSGRLGLHLAVRAYKSAVGMLNIYEIMFEDNVPAYIVTTKWCLLKVTVQVTTPGAESAVYETTLENMLSFSTQSLLWSQWLRWWRSVVILNVRAVRTCCYCYRQPEGSVSSSSWCPCAVPARTLLGHGKLSRHIAHGSRSSRWHSKLSIGHLADTKSQLGDELTRWLVKSPTVKSSLREWWSTRPFSAKWLHCQRLNQSTSWLLFQPVGLSAT